jgi:hypothetical protein
LNKNVIYTILFYAFWEPDPVSKKYGFKSGFKKKTEGKNSLVYGCLIVRGTGVPGERRESQVEHRPSLAAFNLDLD